MLALMADALIISRPLSKKGERENEGEREACGEIDDWALLPLRPSVRPLRRPSVRHADGCHGCADELLHCRGGFSGPCQAGRQQG